MCSDFLVLVTSLAAEFCSLWSFSEFGFAAGRRVFHYSPVLKKQRHARSFLHTLE